MDTVLLGKIKIIMRAKGYSQARLAQAVGVSRISMNRYLGGWNDMNSSKVLRILEVLGILNLNQSVDDYLNAIPRNYSDKPQAFQEKII